MNTETNKILQTRFQELPPAVREKILAIDLSSELTRIVETTLLQKEQLIAIENEILFVFLGFDDVTSLTTNIAHSADITRERAEKYSRAIQQQIFLPNAEIIDYALKTYADTTKKQNETTDGIATNLSNQTREEPSPIPKRFLPQKNTLPKTQTSPTQPTVPVAPPVAPAQPTPPVVPSKEMFAEKMEKQVHIPKDEQVVEKKEPAPKPTPAEPDPYREPPE